MNGLNDIDSSQLGTGHYRYENTMRYTGQMIAHGALEGCTFQGEGRFEWTTYNADGTVKNWSNRYDGEWNKGSTKGLVGTMTYAKALKGTNEAGLYYFTGVMADTGLAQVDQTGQGKIVYEDGTYYIGEVYLNSDHVVKATGNGTVYNADGSVKE